MILYFATEARFVKRGVDYYSLGGFTSELWRRYLEHFDEIIVIARVIEDDTLLCDEKMIASCKNVRFIELPYYVGFVGYLSNRKAIRRILMRKIHRDGCFICRLPGQIGGELISVLRKKHIPYACEVVGNPKDVFSKDSINHPLRSVIKALSVYNLKKQVYNADACLYVTQKTLQEIYPVKVGTFSVGVSDVIIKEHHMSKNPKVLHSKDCYSLISIGSLSQMYKAPDILLQSLHILKNRGILTRLIWLGDGLYRKEMMMLANRLDLDVDFKGNVPPNEVHENLDKADLFILVSRTEGLPRAVVEAMSHGLPCIGSKVGGIPELLDESVLVDKNNPYQLAQMIEKMICDLEFTNKQAEINLQKAMMFKEDNLIKRRNSFFDYIKSKTIIA